MSTPTQGHGVKAQSRVLIQIASKLLRAAFMQYDSASQEGKVLLTSIKNLDRIGGDTANQDLQPAEMKMLQDKVSQGSTTPPAGPSAPSPGMTPTGPSPMPMREGA